MEPLRLTALLAGAFFLTFGLTAYRHFYQVLGAAAGLALWSAMRESLIQLPGLREHPGTAAFLALILLCTAGVLLVTRFRRVLVFIGGLGTGVILSGVARSFFGGTSFLTEPLRLAKPDLMDLLAGLVAALLFLLFERFFALVLTSSLGGLLCAWTIGGRWTFPACFLLGMVVQPFIAARIGKDGKGNGQGGKSSGGIRTGGKGTTVLTGMLLVFLLPSLAVAFPGIT